MVAMSQQLQIGLQNQENETAILKNTTVDIISSLREKLESERTVMTASLVRSETDIITLSIEAQKVKEESLIQEELFEEKLGNMRPFIESLQKTLTISMAKVDILEEEKDRLIISTHLEIDKARTQLRRERKHCANLMFVIHSQRGMMGQLRREIKVTVTLTPTLILSLTSTLILTLTPTPTPTLTSTSTLILNLSR
jgi:hypothetical protein